MEVSPYIYCIVYHYTKRATLARLLANEGPAIYIVHLNRYFCYASITLFSSHFSVTHGAMDSTPLVLK